MDALRGAAILLVAIWHAFSIPYDTIPPGVGWVSDFLSVFRIPMLLFLSGLLLDQSLAKGTRVYLGGKLRRIAWPLLVWSTVFLLIGWPGADPLNPWFWLGDGGALWYLGTLLACYAVGLLVRFVHPVVILAAGLVLMQSLDTGISYLDGVLWFSLYFFAGATLSRWLDRWLSARWFLPTACLVASIAWAAYSATTNGYAPVSHWRPFVLSVVGVAGVVWFAVRMPRVGWLEWVGERSIVYYVVHVPVIFLTARAVSDVLPAPLTYLSVLSAMLLVSSLMARYLNGSLLFEFPRLGRPGRDTETARPTTAVHE